MKFSEREGYVLKEDANSHGKICANSDSSFLKPSVLYSTPTVRSLNSQYRILILTVPK